MKGGAVKKIEIIIRPEKLDPVRKALRAQGCSGLMISEIEGHGKQKGAIQQWRGEKYTVELMPKMKIEIVAKDSEVDRIVETAIIHAKTGEIGDGKIFISTVEKAIRIRTGDCQESAL